MNEFLIVLEHADACGLVGDKEVKENQQDDRSFSPPFINLGAAELPIYKIVLAETFKLQGHQKTLLCYLSIQETVIEAILGLMLAKKENWRKRLKLV